MALFEDKNKPVNIYARGSATAKAQEATSKVSPLAGAAKVYDTVTTPAQSIIKAATQPVRNAMAGQDAALGRQQLRSNIINTPQGNPASFRQVESPRSMIAPKVDAIKERLNGFATNQTITGTPAAQRAGMTGSRVVGGNMPGYTPQFGEPAQPEVKKAVMGGQKVYTNMGNNVFATNQPLRENIIQPQNVNTARVPNAIKTGGYSVQFDPTVSQSQRNAFVNAADYSPEANAARQQERMQWLARNGYERVNPNTGMTASEVSKSMQPPKMFTAADGMGKRERIALNQQLLANQGQREKNLVESRIAAANTGTHAEIARMKDRREAEANSINRLNIIGRNEVDRRQADIQGRIAESQITGNQFEMETKKEARERQNEMNRMRDNLAKEKDETKRKQLYQEIIDRGFAEQKPEEYEFKTMKQPVNPDLSGGGEVMYKIGKRGGAVERVAGEDAPPQAPPEALERLKKYKDYDNFKAKYGYIPAGY